MGRGEWKRGGRERGMRHFYTKGLVAMKNVLPERAGRADYVLMESQWSVE